MPYETQEAHAFRPLTNVRMVGVVVGSASPLGWFHYRDWDMILRAAGGRVGTDSYVLVYPTNRDMEKRQEEKWEIK